MLKYEWAIHAMTAGTMLAVSLLTGCATERRTGTADHTVVSYPSTRAASPAITAAQRAEQAAARADAAATRAERALQRSEAATHHSGQQSTQTMNQ